MHFLFQPSATRYLIVTPSITTSMSSADTDVKRLLLW
jgi:hypothetical protein